MPFIRGRYYANPIAGGAIEAAREAEEALLASRDSSAAGQDQDGNDSSEEKPIHRIEIEVAELVPAQSGRGTKGYIARLHRDDPAGSSAIPNAQPAENRVFYDQGQLVNFLRDELAKNGTR
jgi:hypothetical protein